MWFKRFLIKAEKEIDDVLNPKLYITNVCSDYGIWKERYRRYTKRPINFGLNLRRYQDREKLIIYILKTLVNNPEGLIIYDYPKYKLGKIHKFLVNNLNPNNPRYFRQDVFKKLMDLSEYNFKVGDETIDDSELFESQHQNDIRFKRLMK